MTRVSQPIVGLTAYGVLSRGLISGHWNAGHSAPGDHRVMNPRFAGGNVEHNLALVEALRRIASGNGCAVAQLAIAWVSAQGPDIVPLVGARHGGPVVPDHSIELTPRIHLGP